MIDNVLITLTKIIDKLSIYFADVSETFFALNEQRFIDLSDMTE